MEVVYSRMCLVWVEWGNDKGLGGASLVTTSTPHSQRRDATTDLVSFVRYTCSGHVYGTSG